MIINFDNMSETHNLNFKGGEQTFHVKTENDGINKIMLGRLEPGASIGLHTHFNDSEIIYFIEGSGTVLFDGEKLPIRAGQSHYCPKGHDHSLINTGSSDLRFFATVVQQ
ncbi:MAG: cupin domain-containing protein [Clostridia bacterium]|nr:cupin domain-containing protein [Clostridia bacterium]